MRLYITPDQREPLESGKVSSIILLDPSLPPPPTDTNCRVFFGNGVVWNKEVRVKDFQRVPVSRLRKYGFSNDFVRQFASGNNLDSRQEVAVARIKISRR